MTKYIPVIGLEMHCEVKSNSKVFSPARNNYDELANINVSVIDMGFPGILPTINKECVRKAIMMASVLNCTIPEYMYFDRKNYYYPDLPKGYQITQMHDPVGTNGYLNVEMNGYEKKILIHDIHLEEDSAALEHLSKTTLINYNRAGVPLLELVTEPCFNSSEEAVYFLETVRRIYQYCDISDADTKKGQIRCDVNVSIMKEGSNLLGTKVEIKNVNSFSNVEKAINYEIKRQTNLAEAGRYDEVEQETRRYDEESDTTIRMRSKVDAIDYKYFVEPNIPRYHINKDWIEDIKKSIPALPNERKIKYLNEFGLSLYDTNIIIKEKNYADYFEKCVELGITPKVAANYLITNIIAYLNKTNMDINDFYVTPEYLKDIIDAQNKGVISSKQAKDIFNKCIEERKEPKSYITDDIKQVSDEDELGSIIDNILASSPNEIEAYKNGRTNILGFFVGQVMKETKGKANPGIVNELLKNKLEK